MIFNLQQKSEFEQIKLKYKNLDDSVPVHLKPQVKFDDGSIYLGEWNNNDNRHGIGIQTFPDESKYSGQWKNDKPNGMGNLKQKDGSYYEGQWLNGKADGYIKQMVIYMKENGKMKSKKEKKKKYGLMVQYMKGNLLMG